MTERTPEFLALYPRRKRRFGPDYDMDQARCCEMVWQSHSRERSQCQRKNGHGPHGAYCKMHDPVAKKAKDDARHAEMHARRDAQKRDAKFTELARDAVKKIAAGHNDPAGLCRAILAEVEPQS